MKKILFINDLISAGGVEVMMKCLIENMDLSRFDITVMSAYYESAFTEMYSERINYISLEPKNIKKGDSIITKLNNKSEYKKNNRKIKKIVQQADVIVLMAIKTGKVTKWVADMPCKRKIAWLHGDLCVQNIEFTKEELESLKKFEKIVCVANTVKKSASIVWGDDLNYLVRYNPVDTKTIIKQSLEELDEMVKPQRVLFVTVGRLSAQKAYERLIRVCKKLNENYDFELWIIGDGEKRNELENLSNSLGLYNVKFIGNKENPYPYIKAADWFVSSSKYEGFSLVSQEAVVLEKPIIATECSGVRELLGNSDCGIVVDNTEEALYYGMKKTLDEPKLKKIYEDRVKQRKSFVNLENRVKDIVDLF